MKLLSAEFVTSVAAGGELPADARTVVALVGRSNVGKSTLVNTLGRCRIARAGAKPGTTRLANVYRFRVAAPGGAPLAIHIVDLPGYGYARGPRETTATLFETLTNQFFSAMVDVRPAGRRPWLAGAALVVDVRHPGLDADLSAHAWLAGRGCPVVIVATKGDRLSRTARRRALDAHTAALDAAVTAVSPRGDTRDVDGIWRQFGALATRSEPRRRRPAGEAPA